MRGLPLEASSGKTIRHRLNRGGDRDANRALHVILVVRLRCHQPTRDHLARRLAEGKTKNEIMRCLKRYIARETYRAVQESGPKPLPQHMSIGDRGQRHDGRYAAQAREHPAECPDCASRQALASPMDYTVYRHG